MVFYSLSFPLECIHFSRLSEMFFVFYCRFKIFFGNWFTSLSSGIFKALSISMRCTMYIRMFVSFAPKKLSLCSRYAFRVSLNLDLCCYCCVLPTYRFFFNVSTSSKYIDFDFLYWIHLNWTKAIKIIYFIFHSFVNGWTKTVNLW